MALINRRFTDSQKIAIIREYERESQPMKRNGKAVLDKYKLHRSDIYRFRNYLASRGLYEVPERG